MSFELVSQVLTSGLVAGGTFTVAYPVGTDAGSFFGALGHTIVTSKNDVFVAPTNFTLSFGASNITVTSVNMALPAGTQLTTQLERKGLNDGSRPDIRSYLNNRVTNSLEVVANLGAPDTADDDAIIAAATGTEMPNASTKTYTPDTNGTSPTDGALTNIVTVNGGVNYWKLDTPRAIDFKVTHASSIVACSAVVTGLDEFLVPMTQSYSITATGTSKTAAGTKAFAYVRSVAITAVGDATANTGNIGFSDVLGIPVFLSKTGMVIKELQDGTAPTAGTLVAGNTSVPSATTGDARGTYDPNAACDGSKVFELIVATPDVTYRGLGQA